MANDYYRNQNNRPMGNGQPQRRPSSGSASGARRPAQHGTGQPAQQRRRTPEQIAAARRRAAEKRRRERNKRILITSCLVAVMLFVFVFCIVQCTKDDGGVVPSQTTGGVTTAPDTTAPQTTAAETIVTTAPETQPPELAAPIPTFKADLSAYEMYMNPTGDKRDAYLTLVNNNNPLPADFVPPTLVDVKSTRKDGRATQQLQEYAAKALEALMLEAEACGMVRTNTPSGYPLSVMSAYRTYQYQGQLFNGYITSEMNKGYSRAEAEKIVATYSARPGTSEHQLGLSVDMHTLTAANQAFKNQPESDWLAENCHKFGFILRFPEDKMEITGGIIYEPWHFRYVGRYHATRMKELGFCLEEYVEYLKTNNV